MPRRAYLDWLRGLAVVIMILWHSIDAWTRASDRHGTFFYLVSFIGGWAAPLFLFLAGVAVPFSRAPVKRGWQVFGLAFLFRWQSFILNPGAPWISLLKPDILNILGLGIVAAGYAHARAKLRLGPLFWLAMPAVVIVLTTPWSRQWLWPGRIGVWLPPLEAYIRPVSSVGGFSIFPWLAFVFAGAYVGTTMSGVIQGLDPKRPTSSPDEASFHLRLALAGLALALAGYAGSFLPSPLARSEFWTTSLSFFLIRLGVMIVLVPIAWLWMRRPRRSKMVVFGTTSLFVYWVHVELAYGFASYPLHGALPLRWALVGFVGLTAAMLGAAMLWSSRRRPAIPAYLRPGAIRP